MAACPNGLDHRAPPFLDWSVCCRKVSQAFECRERSVHEQTAGHGHVERRIAAMTNGSDRASRRLFRILTQLFCKNYVSGKRSTMKSRETSPPVLRRCAVSDGFRDTLGQTLRGMREFVTCSVRSRQRPNRWLRLTLPRYVTYWWKDDERGAVAVSRAAYVRYASSTRACW